MNQNTRSATNRRVQAHLEADAQIFSVSLELDSEAPVPATDLSPLTISDSEPSPSRSTWRVINDLIQTIDPTTQSPTDDRPVLSLYSLDYPSSDSVSTTLTPELPSNAVSGLEPELTNTPARTLPVSPSLIPVTSTSSTMGQDDKHTIVYQQKVHVPRFDGSQPELLGTFFQQLESYVNSKVTAAIRSDAAEMAKLYLAELPNHIDRSADVADAIYCLGQGISDWQTLKNTYFDFFRSKQHTHPVHQLAGLLNYRYDGKSPALVYVSKTWKRVETLIQSLQNDPDRKWARDADGKLSLQEFGALIHQTLIFDALPPKARELMLPHLGPKAERYVLGAEAERCLKEVGYPTVKTVSSAATVATDATTTAVFHRPGAGPMMRPSPQNTNYRLPGSEKRDAEPRQMSRSTGAVAKERRTEAVDSNVMVPGPNQCHNCLMMNHYARDCRSPPYCPFHRREGHAWRDCKAYSSMVAKVEEKLKSRSFPRQPRIVNQEPRFSFRRDFQDGGSLMYKKE